MCAAAEPYRVTGNLFVTFVTDATSTQRQIIKLEYQATPRVSVSGVRDQNGGFAFDVTHPEDMVGITNIPDRTDTSAACPERPILPFPIAQEKANPADNEDSNPVLKFPGEVPAHHEYIKVAGERKNGR